MIESPFRATYQEETDSSLASGALQGNKECLRELVHRHHTFIYNVAMKMYGRADDAEDLCQEVLVKMITSLESFRGESSFRTWLYRMVVNHFINTRRRKAELLPGSFDDYFAAIDAIPDQSLDLTENQELNEAVTELRFRCTTGMLMCLDREQRLTFIFGEMFGVDHKLGAEIFGVTPGNFRVRLKRAREDLYEWMRRRCGLVDSANPCRCHKKTKGFIEAGLVDPKRLLFHSNYRNEVETFAHHHAHAAVEAMYEIQQRIFLEHPFQNAPISNVIDDVLTHPSIKQFVD